MMTDHSLYKLLCILQGLAANVRLHRGSNRSEWAHKRGEAHKEDIKTYWRRR